MATLSNNGSAVDGAAAAVSYLEDSALTNSGYGSCLTQNGRVECDSGIMCGKSLRFAAVGALSAVRNPILVAKLLLQEQLNCPKTKLGRVHPALLCGNGAVEWLASKSPSLAQPFNLVSEKAYSDWLKYRSWLDKVETHVIDTLETPPKRARTITMDTVGAVCVDLHGNVASAVSSGGIALKQEGRIGQASVYGCGCWAEENDFGKVAVVTSGTGEQLIRTQLAQRSSEKLLSSQNSTTPDILKSVLIEGFLESRFLTTDDHRYAGLAGLLCTDSSLVEIFFGHTTEPWNFPKTFVSRKSNRKRLCISAFPHRLQLNVESCTE
ncbi:taspase, threonine aspartase, 1 [Paragonimus westermani]|uniref:Taspase, threonine aspartase, 1 n=2 Tax=Paragonimus westermani TaxID=34504 RepID=A0A5J4NRR3_9TREM|nr:taspase, threonine aspartase, 1 [Paragonimus westermani]